MKKKHILTVLFIFIILLTTAFVGCKRYRYYPKYEKSQIDYSLHSNMEMLNNFRGLDEAIQNTMEIANACNVNIKFGEYHMPSYSSNINSFDYLKALCFKGLQKRLSDKFINTKEIIIKSHFINYL